MVATAREPESSCKQPMPREGKHDLAPGKSAGDPPPKRQRKVPCEGESIAREAVSKKDFSVAAVTRALQGSHIPFSASRKNVIPDGQEGIHGMILGLFVFAANMGCSSATEERPWLTRLLSEFVHERRPDFPFTSIQVNKDYASRPHVDKNNLGSSLIIGLGSYEGGETWVQDDDGDDELELGEDIISPHHYRKGRSYQGRRANIRDELCEFDGNRLHYTLPFTGERFSLVFFTCDRYHQASPEVREKLTAAGFRFAWSCEKLQQMLLEKTDTRQRLRKEIEQERLEEIRLERAKLGRCFGRTWNKGWGGACPRWRSKKDEFFCLMHAPGTWKTHGRIDGPIPEAKQEEMAKWQRIMTRNGESPPDPMPGGSCLFVPLPASHSGKQACWLAHPGADAEEEVVDASVVDTPGVAAGKAGA
mmetsp:Transcript_43424/g.128464  ORF Transcript_43424/g.128464 Transcript_43424/m.128464 type:complete len:419 (+) Transcript_43424:39-1295(+)